MVAPDFAGGQRTLFNFNLCVYAGIMVLGQVTLSYLYCFGVSTSRIGITLAALPGVVMIALFYSLALHMHRSLGGWPTSIGERGFPSALVTHSAVTAGVFTVLVLSLFVLPIPILICLLVQRWRRFAVYFAVYAGVVLLGFAFTQLAAPAQFLYWWRD